MASSLNAWGQLLSSQGKFAEAAASYRQALALHRQLDGAEHPTVATSLNNLAAMLQELSDFGTKYLVLAAGFDLMAGDPVPRNGGFAVTTPGLKRIADRVSSLRLPTVIVQEGGYNLDRLGEYAVTLLGAFG